MKTVDWKTSQRRSPTGSSSWFVVLMMLVGLVMVGIGMWSTDKATPVPNTSTQQSQFASADLVEQTNTPLSQSAYTSKAIEQIRLGDRVLGQNPQVSDEERELFSQIDPATWRHIRLRMTKPDGSLLHIDLLRPSNWFEMHDAAQGRMIWLDLSELGAVGEALVLKVNPCTPIKPGEGQVVTGTFAHEKSDVIDLHVSGQTEPLGVTANHPFWSEDRQVFVEAGHLQVGEQLRTMEGFAQVVSIIPRAGPHAVYNLEVNGEHVYRVGEAGVLVHNSYADEFVRMKWARQLADQGDRIFQLTKNELKFVESVLKVKPNLQVYRTNQKGQLGDFLFVDKSNPEKVMGFLVDLKSKSGAAGNQLSNAVRAITEFELIHIEKMAGTTDEIMDLITNGRKAFPQ